MAADAAEVGVRPPVYAPPPVYVAPPFSWTWAISDPHIFVPKETQAPPWRGSLLELANATQAVCHCGKCPLPVKAGAGRGLSM
jgi:hypothetical protein